MNGDCVDVNGDSCGDNDDDGGGDDSGDCNGVVDDDDVDEGDSDDFDVVLCATTVSRVVFTICSLIDPLGEIVFVVIGACIVVVGVGVINVGIFIVSSDV